jgi:hypothetical protein
MEMSIAFIDVLKRVHQDREEGVAGRVIGKLLEVETSGSADR